MKRRAEAFPRNAERLIDESEWDLAVFSLEQYCQLLIRFKLLIKHGGYTRTHSLRRLIRELGESDRRILRLVEDTRYLHYIARLEEAYVTLRYLPYVYEERELGTYTDSLLRCSPPWRYRERILHMLKNYREAASKVKRIVKMFDPEARVFVFGSMVRGKYTGASDIDLLIVTEKTELKYKIMVEVCKTIDAPIELHIITQYQLDNWYKRFIPAQELQEL